MEKKRIERHGEEELGEEEREAKAQRKAKAVSNPNSTADEQKMLVGEDKDAHLKHLLKVDSDVMTEGQTIGGENFEDLCGEDKILVFFKRLLIELKRDEKLKAKKYSRKLQPLFELCRNKVLPDGIRKPLMAVVDCCMKRDYNAAIYQYFLMVTENIGKTMYRDETARNYFQSVQFLMKFCQRRFPTSKAVEFNNVANCCKLQARDSTSRSFP